MHAVYQFGGREARPCDHRSDDRRTVPSDHHQDRETEDNHYGRQADDHLARRLAKAMLHAQMLTSPTDNLPLPLSSA